jgi:hypothetical protein
MEKKIVEEIRACKRKDKQDKWVAKLGSIIEQTTWKIVEKCSKTQFIQAWILTIVVEVGDHFHHDFQIGLWIDPCKYMGVNIVCTTWA